VHVSCSSGVWWPPPSLTSALGSVAPVATSFHKRSFRLALLIIGVAVVVAVPVVIRKNAQRRDQHMTSSCANHAIQLRFLVMTFVEKQGQFPSESDTRSALARMSQPSEHPSGWLTSVSSACPESFLRDKSIGYLFVADGLPTKSAVESSALVLFCPADSHQGSQQHCHAVVGHGELVCIKSNAEMMDLLRREIGRAKQGMVPYSSNAVSTMERELKSRDNYARKREPKVTGANAGGSGQLPVRTRWPARIAELTRWTAVRFGTPARWIGS
jgi:hypothetical protein